MMISQAKNVCLNATNDIQEYVNEHLLSIYCVYRHLEERLSEIDMNTDFADIKPALSEVIQESKGIIKKFQQLFLVIKFQPEPEKCNLIVKQLDDYFARVQLRSWHKLTRNVNLLTYFQYGENKVYLSSIFLKEISNIYGMSHVDELLGIQQSVTPACAAIKYKLRRQINQ